MFMFFYLNISFWSFGQIIIINTDLKKKQQTIHHFYFNAFFQRQFCRMNENDLYRKKSAVFFFIERISDYRIIGNSGKVGEYNS